MMVLATGLDRTLARALRLGLIRIFNLDATAVPDDPAGHAATFQVLIHDKLSPADIVALETWGRAFLQGARLALVARDEAVKRA